MQPSDLAFYTTTELIEELMRRKTFLGVVIHSDTEHRQSTWTGDKVFRVHLNSNMDCEQAGRLLEVVSAHLERSSG
jgi:hypothetical protein